MAIIPLYDHNPTWRRPVVTYAVIAICIFLYLVTDPGEKLFESLTLRSNDLTNPFGWYRFISYSLIHAGFGHLFGNLMFFWIFANNIEELLGHKRFLFFLLLSSIISAAGELFFWNQANPDASLHLVGASGAVAAVMGAYLRFFPKARITVLFFILPLSVPAWIALCAWLLLQFLGLGGDSHVAYIAHITGFVLGFLTLQLLVSLRPAWLVPHINFKAATQLRKKGRKRGQTIIIPKETSKNHAPNASASPSNWKKQNRNSNLPDVDV